jgi:hypothetical protein
MAHHRGRVLARAVDPRTLVYGEEEISLFFSQNGKIIEGVSIFF